MRKIPSYLLEQKSLELGYFMSKSERPEPRIYQTNARDQVVQAIDEGKTVILVLLPTGMGKTFITTLSIEALIENGTLKKEDKILFLVNDRKLKHQLYQMSQTLELNNYGDLFLLPEGRQSKMEAGITRKHAQIAKFIFATPMLLLNSIIARTPGKIKVARSTLDQVKLVVIDEIFDVLAQSVMGKTTRTKEETIQFVEKVYDVKFQEVVDKIAKQYNIRKEQVVNRLVQEFSAKKYRLNKRFEPILNLLGLIDGSEKLVIGMTASFTQREKLELLTKTFGGPEKVAEVYPTGEDYEDFTPNYIFKKIVVFDDWVSDIDAKIQKLKGGTLKTINQAYQIITKRPYVPNDRIMLFISDLLGKKPIQERLKGARDEQFLNRVLTHSSAYIQLVVARQYLLENTLRAFIKFIARLKNAYLLKHQTFKNIKERILSRKDEVSGDKVFISKKEERLLFWLKRFIEEGKKALVLCRFVSVTQYLHQMMQEQGFSTAFVHGKLDGSSQHAQIMRFKTGDAKILFASERLIEKGTDLPEADVAIYYGVSVSLSKYEQSVGRIRSFKTRTKTVYTLAYHQTAEEENAFKRDALFLELLGKHKKRGMLVSQIVEPEE